MAKRDKAQTFDAICSRIATGESLRAICADKDMPDVSTVCRWLSADNNGDLCKQYARAREAQADTIFDEILDIADNAANDWMERQGEGGEGWTLNGEHIQRSRLRIDARKWMAGKLRPKVYGDKVLTEHTGADGDDIKVSHTFDVDALPLDTIESLMRAKKSSTLS